MKRITIHITQKHIRAGIRRSSNKCPIALAIQEKLGLGWEIAYGRAWKANKYYCFLPAFIYGFELDFDTCGQAAVSPTSFVLHLDTIA